jgi:hypothetical protein
MRKALWALRASALGIAGALGLSACAPDVVDRSDPGGVGPTGAVAGADAAGRVPGLGEVGVVCGVSRRDLGTRVARIPERGRTRWALYDTAPGSAEARAFHVTGFRDGCARRITGALAMFGSVELYELVHFAGIGAAGEIGETDRAYRALRASVCGNRDTPCPERPLKRLTRDTAFLTVYPRNGNPRHMEMLLHAGALKATAAK